NVATLPRAHPQPDPATFPVGQLLDHQARPLPAVDVHTHLWLLHHDPDVEPGVPVRRRDDRLLVPPRLALAEHLPAVLRVGDVLNGAGPSLRLLGPEVEWAKVDRVVGLLAREPEGDAKEVAVGRATPPEGIELDHPVRELNAVEGDDRVVLF